MKIDKANQLELKETNNGYILKKYIHIDDDDKGNKIFSENVEVIELEDYKENETIIKLLEKVAEWAGYSYNKYGKENLEIKFNKKGRKL